MIPLQWHTIVANMQIAAQPIGLWTPVVEYLPAGTLVRVFAWGSWVYSSQMMACGPDGERVSFISPQYCLTKAAQVGALIGKIGGGTADLGGTVLPVGSQCVFRVPEGGGSFYMTINDEIGGFDDNVGFLTVSVSIQLADVSIRSS